MLYDLRVLLGTRYDRPAGPGRHLARLRPRDEPGQRVLRADLRVDPPPTWREEGADFFGNPVTAWASPGEGRHVEAVMTARVERLARAPLRGGLARADLPAALGACRDLGPLSPLHFTGPSPLLPPAPAIAAWAREVAGGAPGAREAAGALGRALHRRMAFDGEATEVDTPASEAFAAGRGVCQDYAHVLICGLRALGIPAGYVSGLIRTTPPPGRARLQGADAMHAWVMAWCGAWVEIDPTNDREAGLDHVVVARGRDYADVAPIRGVLRMAGEQAGRHAVDVVPVG